MNTRELVSSAVAPAAPALRVIARTSSGSHPTRTYPPTDTYPLTDTCPPTDAYPLTDNAYPPTRLLPTRSPQFNLDVVELDAHAKSLQPWRSKRAPDAGRLPPLILEVYVSDLGPAAHAGDAREPGDEGESDSRKRNPRVLIERWVLRHDDDDADTAVEQGSESSKPGRTNAETVAVAYKRTVVMVRALHALCRSLPANRFHKAARRSQCRGLRFAMAHEVRTGGSGGGDVTVRNGDVTVQEKPSGGDFGEYSFTPVRTPAGGSLRATVFFLNADKLAGMDCVPTPTAPRVIDGYLGGGAPGPSGAHPRAGPFLPSSASTSPFSPASADAPAPPRRDFGFGTSPTGSSVAPAAAVPPSTSAPSAARPSRQNSWAGKATYGFGASPERAGKGASSNTLSLNTPAATRGDDRAARGDSLPRAGSRGMLSEAIAEQKASEEGGAESARTEGGVITRGESSVNRSSTKPPPSPPHQIYGFGVGSLGTAQGLGTNAAGSPSLPFASTSQPTRFTPTGGSGPRGGGFSTSLASGDHALARRAREFGRGGGDPGWSGGGGGSRPQSARGGVDDSPPWHFRGFSGALSGSSPGSTPGGGTTPRGSHGSHGPSGGVGPGQSSSGPRSNPIGVYYAGSPGGRPRRPSWSSPSSSLSASLHGDVAGGGGIGSLVGGALSAPLGSSPGRPYSYGGIGFNGAPHSFNGAPHSFNGAPYSFNGAPYSYGASPGASPGGSFANAMAHLRAQRAGQGAGSGTGVAIQPGFNSTNAGELPGARRIPDSYGAMFESADSDPLPFALDDDDEGGPGFDHGSIRDASTGGKSSQTGSPSVDSPDRRDRDREGSSFGMVGGGGRSDAAVGALVRMLQDAAPLSAEWGDERRGVGERGDAGWGAEGGASASRSSRGEADGEVERASSSGDDGGGEMTLDWALSQLSRFRDFKASLDESTSTLEAVEERPNGEEGGTE